MAIRNGDAHLKNFGFVYASANDVRLSPVFDMLSVSVYSPRARLISALLCVGQAVVAQTATRPDFAPTAKRMLELWSFGCRIHSADAARQLISMAASLGTAIEKPASHAG